MAATTDAKDAAGPIQDASTVLLVRDREDPGGGSGGSGIEVFVVERRKAGAFAGILAFPGGKVEDADRDLPAERWTGLDLDARVAAANEAAAAGPIPDEDDRAARVVTPRDELGWSVAAVREVFEEVGALLATRGGRPVTSADLAEPSFLDARARLVARGEPWDWTDWLAREELVLDLGALVPWAWWVTPIGEPRRFDTRFFAAAMPAGQDEALGHDEVEAVSSRWCTVDEVEADRRAGRSVVIYPTRRNLHLLDGHASVDDVLQAMRTGAELRPCQPTLRPARDEDPQPTGDLVAQHPWDGTVEELL